MSIVSMVVAWAVSVGGVGFVLKMVADNSEAAACWAMKWVCSHPAAAVAIKANEPQIKAILEGVEKGLEDGMPQ